MENITNIIGLAVTLLSFGYAVYQHRNNHKTKQLYNQNIRKLWDIARSNAPFRIYTDKLKSSVNQNKEVISFIESSHMQSAFMFRELTPLYVQTLGKKLTYDFIKSMITNEEIGSMWTLRLVLSELPVEKRSADKDKECQELLKETKTYVTSLKGHINNQQRILLENRKENSK
jgi:hypothetical protein